MSSALQLGQAWDLVDMGGEGLLGVTDLGYGAGMLDWCHNTTPLLIGLLLVIAILSLAATARRMGT